MLNLHNLSCHLKDKPLLSNITVQASPGSFVGLIGENGAGKTTLLRTFTGLLQPSQGRSMLNNQCLLSLPAHRRPSTFSYFSMENTEIWHLPVHEILSLFNLDKHNPIATALDISILIHQSFHTLSSGQKQRVILALHLAKDLPLYVLDEPLNSLDHRHQHQVMRLLKQKADQGKIVLASCHQLDLVQQYCADVWLLDKGTLAHHGPTNQILRPAILKHHFGI
tara:strand:+ start:14699 stop:15367 length:669 start_codon:yes stop_codon:yes gene_type:complete